MSRVDISLDLKGLGDQLRAMGSQAPLIMARSLNRAGTAGKTAMTRTVTAASGIRAKDVGRAIVVDKANRTQLKVTFRINAERIPLIAFGARGPEPSGKGRGRRPGRRGVTARTGGVSKRYPGAFIATVSGVTGRTGDHRGVFIRKGSSSSGRSRGAWSPNLPIVELRGPSVGYVFVKHIEVFRAAAQDALIKNLAHEIDFANRPTAELPEGA